ncbi:MAG TPA: protein kinase [Kofleriaceae bacterium]|nr:protein kinase [Kofleriaceae bacterium]
MALEREVEDAATLPLEENHGSSVPSGTSPPTAAWDRYELLELLGKGGMGAVYKARDRRLGRTLAIKLIQGADPNLTLRFLREARAQARIDHPNVCRVYEVGEVEGRPYIALQLVAGEPLHQAAARMSLDEQIAAMRDVALAIQEAHRLGIVHRDIKPANILVERTADGRVHPVVMDFGLARETTVEAGLTETGALLGTPAYMSPEQARGDVRAVDRRSDVYSLGATLYELLTGRAPFSTTSLAETLRQVIHDDPPAPRGVVRSLPVDLETIVLQCLAKDPAQRYPSARALADDLGRYLDGEPILGRRLSLWQRLRQRARRHRALVLLGAWSLAIIVALGVFGVRAWIRSNAERARAAEGARLAERLAQDAKEIETTLQLAYLWPLHDTHPDRARVRERMARIAATHHDLGAFGDAVVHDALGRGHLALHEWQKAVDELSRAKAAGRRSPELSAALGRALGELYHRALEEARRSGDKTWLAQRQEQLADQYLRPALTEIQEGRASRDEAALIDARVALYHRDYAAAGKLALAAATPGLAEARKLAADAAYGAALAKTDSGDYEAARGEIARATTLYAEASEIARSDASLYEAAARAWLQLAELDFTQGRSTKEPLDRALDLLERALRADPDGAGAYRTKTYVLLRRYRSPTLYTEREKVPLLEDITQAAETAVKLDPRDAHAWTARGHAYVYRGIDALSRGAAAPWLQRAIDALGVALAIQPNHPQAYNYLGMAHRWLATNLEQAGRDPRPAYRAALASYERVTELDPQYVPAWGNQIELHATAAEYDLAVGDDPRLAIASAQRAGEQCLALNSKYFLALEHLARAELTLAHYLVETGGEPTAALQRARGYLDRDEDIHPRFVTNQHLRLVAARVEAAALLRAGADPTSVLADGHAAFQAARQRKRDCADCYVDAARLVLVEAAWRARASGGPAVPLLLEARTLAEQAIALDEQYADARAVAADACLQLATAQPSAAVIEAGLAHASAALERNPRLRRAAEVRAALAQLRAPAP